MNDCRHFGGCGGCAWGERRAGEKAARVKAALAGFGEVAVGMVEVALGTRRRMDLAAVRQGGEILVGLHEARGKAVVDMRECVLLLPGLFALVAPARDLLRRVEGFRRVGSLVANWLDGGADILLRVDGDVTVGDRARMIAFARDVGAVRISVAKGAGEAETVGQLMPPVVTFCGVRVEVGAGCFLQASREGEAAIVNAVLAGLPKVAGKGRFVELYAGVGTISFSLAKLGRVEAYEGSAGAVAAHEGAARRAGLAGRMRVEARDLVRRPVKVSELAGAAALVLDPPFSGAGSQMKAVAEAGLGRVIYVSCNPEALGRDCYLLQKAGYEVLSAVVVDQFAYSDNVESVVVFSR